MASLDFEGRRVALEPDDTIASALFRAGVRTFSRSFKFHRRRGLYCLSGDCPNCMMTVDGDPGVRTCVTSAADGQTVVRGSGWPSAERDLLSAFWLLRRLLPVGFYYKTMIRPRAAWRLAEPVVRRVTGLGALPLDATRPQREVEHHHDELLVVGAGVAGLSAALAAAERGTSVLLADEGAVGEKIPPGPTRRRVDELHALVRERSEITVLESATAIGVYEGPLVPLAAEARVHHVHPARVIIATGATERHGVFSGNDLPGVWLGRGAARLLGAHGIEPGKAVVLAGSTTEVTGHLEMFERARVRVVACAVPERLASELSDRVGAIVDGEIVAVGGRRGVKKAVIAVRGKRVSVRCDAVVLTLGLVPRDGLLRQAQGLPVVGAGDVVAPGCSLDEACASGRAAAEGSSQLSEHDLPAACTDGFACLCEDVRASDLEDAWAEGFRSTELLKRYTTATMGPCQGALCHEHLRSFVRERAGAGAASAATTARPPARPISFADAAAGVHLPHEQRTALHERHLELGADMGWIGTWRRTESYGDWLAEYWAVRKDVGLIDNGTLGKFRVAGPDATEFLERLYPCHIADLTPGRTRYALLLNEAGSLLDDGMVCVLPDGGYYLTFSSSAVDHAETWMRDWAETWGLEVHILNQTAALGAINVTGPRSRELLGALCVDSIDSESFPFMGLRELDVAGVPCIAMRLGFVGELGFELHHPSSQSVRLWEELQAAGAELGVAPVGLEATRMLRLEKGHILVGQDTDFDSTPAKLGFGWAVKSEKPDFVGKAALERLAELEPSQRLAMFEFGAVAPPEGSTLTADGAHAGHLTSSRYSPVLERGVALGWLLRTDGAFPELVKAGDATARVVTEPFYDPDRERLRA